MWTRTYLLLLALRLYLALAPSYIHPDENFQGPEVIAGKIFNFPNHLSWEFTSNAPVRSVYPLWPMYALPMTVLQWIWAELREEEVAPSAVYYTLRGLMFILSFVLEDWAIHELVKSPQHRRLAVVLVASSYVTWTYQTHTFSNSVETLIVLWSLVMIQRILENKQSDALLSPAILGSLLTFGVFNRITFPAFVLLPGLYLVPHLSRRPLSLLALLATFIVTSFIAVAQDTFFYRPNSTFKKLLLSPIITPINSLLYNSDASNLETHGLHPRYQHILANLPLLLGPALFLLRGIDLFPVPLTTLSAFSGIFILSAIPHQEARFLLPVVPLILISIHLPRSRLQKRCWLGAWIIFNLVFGLLMGIYHQGGVIPMQMWLSQNNNTVSSPSSLSTIAKSGPSNHTRVFWWRTYPPPIWLLDHVPISTTNLMGMPLANLQSTIAEALYPNTTFSTGSCDPSNQVALVAPLSSLDLETWRANSSSTDGPLIWEEKWRYKQHLNLDDLDFATQERGILGEIRRILGKTGLGVWTVQPNCESSDAKGKRKTGGLVGDW